MPRPLFRKEKKVHLEESTQTKRAHFGLSYSSVEERLRQKRSSAYLDTLSQLDTGEKVMSQAKTKQIMDAIQEEFLDLPDSAMPIGIVAACYLGDPYEVHSIDLDMNVILHYKISEPLPVMLEQARSIAQHPSYAYIEVYTDCMRAIDKNGEVAVVKE